MSERERDQRWHDLSAHFQSLPNVRRDWEGMWDGEKVKKEVEAHLDAMGLDKSPLIVDICTNVIGELTEDSELENTGEMQTVILAIHTTLSCRWWLRSDVE